MKKTIAIVSPIAFSVYVVGILFKLLHYPCGGILLLIGSILMILAIILGLSYALNGGKAKGFKIFSAFVALLLVVALSFTILHFPGCVILVLSSGLFLIVESFWAACKFAK